jgi:hypothetical protein
VSSNYAFERPVKPFTSARGQRGMHFAPPAPRGAAAGRSTRALGGMSTRRLLYCGLALASLGIAQVRTEADATGPAPLKCLIGPLKRTFGNTLWDVYSCDDNHSVVVVTAEGSPAMPFVFFFVWKPQGFELHGEGNGNKQLTDAAFADLKALSESDIRKLYTEAAQLGGKK